MIKPELDGLPHEDTAYEDVQSFMKSLVDLEGKTEPRTVLSIDSQSPSLLPGPRISRIMPIVPVTKARSMPEGRNSLGIGALTLRVVIGSLNDQEIAAKADSGADISLISLECLASLTRPPTPKTGMKISLWELTGQSKISGYVHVSLFSPTTEGRLLEFQLEAYVVPGMSVPLILGEDFMITYKISVDRESSPTKLTLSQGHDKHEILASSDSEWKRGFSIRRIETPGFNSQTLLSAKFKQQRKQDKRRQRRLEERLAEQSNVAKARYDVTLAPGTARLIEFDGLQDTKSSWMIDRVTVADDLGFLGAPASLIPYSLNPRISVANPSPHPKIIRKGDILGLIRDPDDFLDHATLNDPLEPRRKALVLAIQKMARGPLNEMETNSRPMRESANQPASVEDPESKDDLWGPKTAEPPDPTTYKKEEASQVIDIAEDAPADFREALLKLVQDKAEAFGFDDRLGNHPAAVPIQLKEGTHPISMPMYSASPAKREVIDAQIDKWIEQEVIEPSKSPWGAPVVIVYRNGKARFCVDYRKLNAVTIPDEFPIPRQSDIMQTLSGAQVLSSLDALSGFTQLTIDEDDREKSAFRSHRGLYQFKRLPFGLRNGPSAFQRVMQGVLAPFLWLFALVYIDDIVVFSKTYDEHLIHLSAVFDAIIDAKLTLSPPKCHLGYSSILLLGLKVSRLGLSTHEEKIQAIVELARPTTPKTLSSFLGMTLYFAQFVPYYSDWAAPLFRLLKKDAKWVWEADHETSFELLKQSLCTAPVLAHPIQGLPYRVYSDASDVAIGTSLQQVQPIALKDLKGTRSYDTVIKAHQNGTEVPSLAKRASKLTNDVPAPGKWDEASLDNTIIQVERVVSYWSRTLRPAERNYSATEREALGVKEALVRFQPFIEGEKVIAITDHAALIWARTYENTNRRLAAWGAVYAAYPELDIVHRAGRVHSNVDPLSRLARIPPHQSPVADLSPAIESSNSKAPAFSWNDLTERSPASKAAFAVQTRAKAGPTLTPNTSGHVEKPEAELSSKQTKARPSNRRRKRTNSKGNQEPVRAPAKTPEASRTPKQGIGPTLVSEPNDEVSSEDEVQQEKKKAKQKRDKAAYPPATPFQTGHLHIIMDAPTTAQFLEGYKEDKELQGSWEKSEQAGPELQATQRFYRSDEGLLIFRDADWVARLCVPKNLTHSIIRLTHDSPSETAHAGAARLYHRLAARFYWPRMWSDVKSFCERCDVCQKTKPDRRAPAGLLRPHRIPLLPWDVVSLDLITGLPPSNGFDAILVIVDKLSKFIILIPTITKLDQKGFALLFIKYVVWRYGLPVEMIADRDARWAKSFWAWIADHLGLKLNLSTSHHPQHDGQTEIVNQTIEIMLRAYVAGDRSKWSYYIDALAHAYNSTPHSSTGYAPFFLVHGYLPRSEVSVVDPISRGVSRPAENAQAIQFAQEWEVHRSRARDALAKAQAAQAMAYNKGRRTEEFEEGDEVLVNPHSLELVDVEGTGKKLVQRRIGPFTITEKIGPTVYRLELPAEYRMHPIINIEHLRKYHRQLPEQPGSILPPMRVEAKEEIYEVAKIVGHRYNRSKRRTEYQVRWKGYGPEDDTFEPESNLRNAFSRLRSYKATLPNKAL